MGKKGLFPPRIELGTFCVLGRRDNRYTMETLSVCKQLLNRFKLFYFDDDNDRHEKFFQFDILNGWQQIWIVNATFNELLWYIVFIIQQNGESD